eukprot:3447507-Pleurochrysis_carterae.AAC.2
MSYAVPFASAGKRRSRTSNVSKSDEARKLLWASTSTTAISTAIQKSAPNLLSSFSIGKLSTRCTGSGRIFAGSRGKEEHG